MVGRNPPFFVKGRFFKMPAIARSEFALALNQVCNERGIEPEAVLETVKAAILSAFRKETPGVEMEEYRVELNSETGEARVFHDDKDVTPPGFGRIAAQTAKQVILQRIREAEKTSILSDYSKKIGTVVNGMVLRFDGPNIVVDVGRAEGVMPPQEQIPSERYRLNQRLTFYIVGIGETPRGSEIIVSRAHRELVAGLFKREVPEIQSGAVQIKEIAREAGNRSKVAVVSTQTGVDPVGSCVGQKGVRVQAVIAELGGVEKIDIIQWSNDWAKFIAAALSPAKEIDVTLREEDKIATATVPDDQLSLAIGREGQNVRLAVKLTGWKIDVRGKSEQAVPVPQKTKPVAVKKVKVSAPKEKKVPKKSTVKKTAAKTKKKTKKKESEARGRP
ncbi:MAG: transcription termination factor NusA [bacterium]|nr:transcription termination factor NusA [bacterium]